MEGMAPELVELYNLLGYYTAAIAKEKGTISQEAVEKFQQVFSCEPAMSKSSYKEG
jgi:hypothetical protein